MKIPPKKILTPSNVFMQTFCIVGGIMALLPLLYAFIVSFLLPKTIYSQSINISWRDFTLANYNVAFGRVNLFRYLTNSFVVATICSLTRALTGMMAGFAMTFLDFKGKGIAEYFILLTAILPQEVLFVQNYSIVARAGLTNSYLGICSVYIVSALSVFIFIQSLSEYPKFIKDAASLDGCGNIRFFFKILIPTNLSTIFAVIFTNFVSLWNMYLWPLVITNTNDMRTSQVAITMIKGRDSPDFGPVMAATIISTIPAVCLFVIAKIISIKNKKT